MVLLFHSARDEAKGWLHCKEKKKSTPPLQERLCDLSVYMTGKVGDAKKDFKIGVLHCEIKSREKILPSNLPRNDSSTAVCSQSFCLEHQGV